MSSSTAANGSYWESLPSEKVNPFAVLGLRAGELEALTQEALHQHYKRAVKHLHEKGPQQLGLTVGPNVPKMSHFNSAKDRLLGVTKKEFDDLRREWARRDDTLLRYR